MDYSSALFDDIEPKVINNQLLQEILENQDSEKTYDFSLLLASVETLRIEYKNIFRIDHLWMFTSLIKLNLSNNLIEKIENLEALTNLQDLNLSFNRISKIEGLETLINLEILSLYSNQIQVIDNLETLENLKILTIGRNKIHDLSSVNYLRLCESLRSLNLDENPCCQKVPNFRQYIVAVLPNLTYYNCKMIYSNERKRAVDVHFEELNKIIHTEKINPKFLRKLEKSTEIKKESDAASFVEGLDSNTLFVSFYNNDPTGKLLLDIVEIFMLYKDFEKATTEISEKVYKAGKNLFEQRQTQLNTHWSNVQGKKDINDKLVQDCEQSFLKEIETLFKSVEELQQDFREKNSPNDSKYPAQFEDHTLSINQIAEQFHGILEQFWKQLMLLELAFFEELEEMNEIIKTIMTEMIDTFKEFAQSQFAECRLFEVDFQENVTEIGLNYTVEGASLPENEHLRKILEDKESFQRAVATSHDMHMLVIDSREDGLVSQASDWLDELIHNFRKELITNNRKKILEIEKFFVEKRSHFDALVMLDQPSDNEDFDDDLNEKRFELAPLKETSFSIDLKETDSPCI